MTDEELHLREHGVFVGLIDELDREPVLPHYRRFHVTFRVHPFGRLVSQGAIGPWGKGMPRFLGLFLTPTGGRPFLRVIVEPPKPADGTEDGFFWGFGDGDIVLSMDELRWEVA